MTEIQQPDFARSTIELLLQQNEVADALALISSWLAKHPFDREANLYFLLAAVHLHGPEAYEQEIDDLRRLSNLDEKEKQLVRKIFILGFHAAERAQQEDKIRAYQRLLRRLLLGQPLDQPIPIAETRRSDIPEIQLDLDVSSPPAAVTLPAEAKKPLPAPRKKTPSKYRARRFAFGIGAVALLVLQIAYFLHSHSQGDGSTELTAKSEVPNKTSMSYVILRRIALREEPRFAGATVQEVDAGTQINILAVHGDWLKVKTRESGIVGYIRREHVIRSDLAR